MSVICRNRKEALPRVKSDSRCLHVLIDIDCVCLTRKVIRLDDLSFSFCRFTVKSRISNLISTPFDSIRDQVFTHPSSLTRSLAPPAPLFNPPC